MTHRWRLFLGLFAGSGRLLGRSLVASLLQAALLVPVAFVVRHVFNTVIPRGELGALIGFGALLLGLFLANGALSLWNRYATLRVTKRAVTRLRSLLVERVYELPQSYFDRADLGTLHAMLVLDSERVDVMANAFVAQLVPACVIGIALIAVLGVVSWQLTLLLLAVVPVLVLISQALRRSVRSRARAWQRAYDAFSRRTQLALRSMALTKAHVAERDEVEHALGVIEELGVAGRSLVWLQNAYTLSNDTVAAGAGVAVLIVGGHAVAARSLSLGALLSFYAVLTLLRSQLTTSLGALPQSSPGWSRSSGSIRSSRPRPRSRTRGRGRRRWSTGCGWRTCASATASGRCWRASTSSSIAASGSR
jgi:ATP-binding cassette subfamily B protein